MKVNLIGPSSGKPPEEWVMKIQYETEVEKSLLASFICASRYDLVDGSHGVRVIRRGVVGAERYCDLFITELKPIRFVDIEIKKEGEQ